MPALIAEMVATRFSIKPFTLGVNGTSEQQYKGCED